MKRGRVIRHQKTIPPPVEGESVQKAITDPIWTQITFPIRSRSTAMTSGLGRRDFATRSNHITL